MIVCLGDYIEDCYQFGKATRLCPEAPVPVIVIERTKTTPGGVGLVADQLRELGADVFVWTGSMSRKTRIYAGNHMVARIDQDKIAGYEPDPFPDEILRQCDCVVVSDYGKGAIFPEIAEEISNAEKPVFVDAKQSWHWYDSGFMTWFPNEEEYAYACNAAREAKNSQYIQIVQKRGARGCAWGEWEFPALVTEPVDTTGAGDIFLAAFVYAHQERRLTPTGCLEFANNLAGDSCRHLGTYVVPKGFAQSVLGMLEPSPEIEPPSPGWDDCSSASADPLLQATSAQSLVARLKEFGKSLPNWSRVQEAQAGVQQSRKSEQIPRPEQIIPTEFDDEGIRVYGSDGSPRVYVTKEELADRYPTSTEHQCERKPEPDQG